MVERVTQGNDRAAGRREALNRARKGRRRWTMKAQDIFFAELSMTANVSFSAKQAGMTGNSAHERRQRDPAFAARWLKALEAGYAALELMLLDQSLNGSERTETVEDQGGAVKQTKRVHSFPHGVAMRLLQGHKETVERYRANGPERDGDDPAAVAKMRAELDRVRARLGGEEVGKVKEDGADG